MAKTVKGLAGAKKRQRMERLHRRLKFLIERAYAVERSQEEAFLMIKVSESLAERMQAGERIYALQHRLERMQDEIKFIREEIEG